MSTQVNGPCALVATVGTLSTKVLYRVVVCSTSVVDMYVIASRKAVDLEK